MPSSQLSNPDPHALRQHGAIIHRGSVFATMNSPPVQVGPADVYCLLPGAQPALHTSQSQTLASHGLCVMVHREDGEGPMIMGLIIAESFVCAIRTCVVFLCSWWVCSLAFVSELYSKMAVRSIILYSIVLVIGLEAQYMYISANF